MNLWKPGASRFHLQLSSLEIPTIHQLTAKTANGNGNLQPETGN